MLMPPSMITFAESLAQVAVLASVAVISAPASHTAGAPQSDALIVTRGGSGGVRCVGNADMLRVRVNTFAKADLTALFTSPP